MAHAHDLAVVAEGVETAGQLAAVRAIGCDEAQGFLLSPPLERDAVEGLAQDGQHW